MRNYTRNIGLLLISVSLATTLGATALITHIGITDRANDVHYVKF